MAADLVHPPRAVLERIAAALGVASDRAARVHVEACAECSARMRDVIAERDAFLALHPPAARTAAIIEATRHARVRIVGGAIAALLAAAVVAVVWWPRAEPRELVAGDRVVAKGGGDPVVSATVRRRGSGVVERIESRSMVENGDSLRFEVNPGSYGWLGVYDVSLLVPVRVVERSPAPAGGLGHDLVVGEGLADEHVVFVFAAGPLDDASARRCIARGAAGCRIVEFWFAKHKPLPTPAPGVVPKP